jgi:hypothetical protein
MAPPVWVDAAISPRIPIETKGFTMNTQTSISPAANNELPPDPECMNSDRSVWAAAAVAAFQKATNTDAEDTLSDLLCDLMHWCDRNQHDFDAELERARNNYVAETMAS